MASQDAGVPARSPRFEQWKELFIDSIRSPLTMVGLIVIAAIIYRAGATIVAGDYNMETFVRQMIFGLAQGSIYALVALGFNSALYLEVNEAAGQKH